MSDGQNDTGRAKPGQDEILVLKPKAFRRARNADYRPSASFVTQIIAAKTRAPIYRAKRRASSTEAQSAYKENDQRKTLRMPMGYLRNLDA